MYQVRTSTVDQYGLKRIWIFGFRGDNLNGGNKRIFHFGHQFDCDIIIGNTYGRKRQNIGNVFTTSRCHDIKIGSDYYAFNKDVKYSFSDRIEVLQIVMRAKC